jgi:hypothetical protein
MLAEEFLLILTGSIYLQLNGSGAFDFFSSPLTVALSFFLSPFLPFFWG